MGARVLLQLLLIAAAGACVGSKDSVSAPVPKDARLVVAPANSQADPKVLADAAADAASETDSALAAADAADTADASLQYLDAGYTRAERADVLLLGRFDESVAERPKFAWPGSAILARFRGTSASVVLEDNGWNHVEVRIDGVTLAPIRCRKGTRRYVLAEGLAAGPHLIRLARRNEGHGGVTTFRGFEFAGGEQLPPPPRPRRRLQFLGDSITCGYGSEGVDPCPFEFHSENFEVTFAALTARYFGAESHAIAKSGWGMSRGADGLAYGVIPKIYDQQMPDSAFPLWDSARFEPDAIVINLSTNDYGKGNPGVALTDASVAFLTRLRATHPRALQLVTTSPMLAGSSKAASVAQLALAVERRVAEGDAMVELLDFDTQSYADRPGCSSHPGKVTHRKMAEKLEAKLAQRLGWTPASDAESTP